MSFRGVRLSVGGVMIRSLFENPEMTLVLDIM